MLNWLWVWGPAVAQMVAIFVASSIPDLTELPGGVSDKTGHFIGYAILGTCVWRALAGARWRGFTTRGAALALLFSSVYGASDEYHQSFVHGRSPDVHDWVADTLGAAAAIAALMVVAAVVRARRARSGAV
jgi:VanZ family protein